MRIFRVLIITVLLLLCCVTVANASVPIFDAAPDVIRPGKYYDISVDVPHGGQASLTLIGEDESIAFVILERYPLQEGKNLLNWDGVRLDGTVIDAGDYTLRLEMEDGSSAEWPLRIGAPYPIISQLYQSDSMLTHTPLVITYTASEEGTLSVSLRNTADGTVASLGDASAQRGENRYEWNGEINGAAVPSGSYALTLVLRASNGAESISHYANVEIPSSEPVTETPDITIVDSATHDVGGTDEVPLPAPEPTTPPLSPPYSTNVNGRNSFWAMTPGETDDAVIWDILMQPITVYDGGIKSGAKSHAYMMENPDGSGAKIAQLHTQSQGINVIGEPNEYGYVLVEAFSNYDREYYPSTDEEQAHAFDLKQGYVLAKNLKTVDVMTDTALLIDKLTQRMYLFKDGVRVTEFLISTGIWSDPKDMLFETIAGEFITVSHTGGFWSGNMYCDMAIRINGGVLLHEVPCKINADKTRNYSSFEGYLGTKQSHGCVRIQRLKNEDGYNHRWLWENLKKGKPYKVIIWDDLNRYDAPETWYPNPK